MILVIGATGLIGGLSARILAREGRPLTLLVRRPTAPGDLGCPAATCLVGDLDDPPSLSRALAGVESVLLVSPSNPDMVRQQTHLVAAIAAANREGQRIRLVKISGFMTGLDSASRSGRWHARIEQAIDEAEIPATALRLPFLMQNLLRMKEWAAGGTVIENPVGNGRIAMLDAHDLARVAAKCLTDASHVGARYWVSGPSAVTFADVAAAVGAATGRSVRYRANSFDEERVKLAGSDMPPWRQAVLLEFYQGFARGLGAEVSPVVETVTGQAPRTLAAFIENP